MYEASRSARHHSRQHRVVHMQRADQVDGYQFVPLFGAGIGKWLEYIPSGVVDQNIDGAQARFGGVYGGIDFDPVGDVASERHGGGACGGDGRGGLCRGVQIDVEYGDVRAFLSEAPAGWPAASAAAPGSDNGFSP